MRVLIVIHYFPPHIGGMEEVARNAATSLATAGHDVTVLTCSHDRRLPRHEVDASGFIVRRMRALNFVETRLGVTFPIVSPLFFFHALRLARAADVVHVHDAFYPSSHAAGLAARAVSRPMVMTQHVALVDHPSRVVRGVQRLMYRVAGRPLFALAERIITYNENVRSFLRDQDVPDAKLLLHHNGIDVDYFSPAEPSERARIREAYALPVNRPIVLFVGRLVPKKGYRLVHDVRGPGHFTLIVGNGYVDTGLGDDNDVRYYGPASREELRDLYRAAPDVFVFPAVGEIFTLVMQEAMAVGLPVVTTDDPGYAEYDLDRTRIELVTRTAPAIADGISRILTDEGRRQAMSEYSRRVAVDRFSWSANFHEELAVYEEATA